MFLGFIYLLCYVDDEGFEYNENYLFFIIKVYMKD